MRLAAPSFCIAAFAVLTVQTLLLAEDNVEPKEKKSGILGRVTRIFTGEKKEEPKPEPPPPPKQEEPVVKKKTTAATTPKPKLKSTGSATTAKSKSKSKAVAKAKPKPESKAETAEKTKAKPDAADSKKSDEPKAETAKAETKPEAPGKESDKKPKKEEPKPDEKPAAESMAKKDEPSPEPATSKKEDEKVEKTEAPMKHSGEFDDISAAFGTKEDVPPAPAKTEQAKPPPEISAKDLPPPPPLPSGDKVWEIVKLDHDYVTADSIQRFYRFNTLKVDGKHVWMRSAVYILKADIGSQELLLNNTKFILSYPVVERNGKALFSRLDLCKLIDPVLMPNHIATAEVFDTVVIDAGHGGHDSGARGVYGYEKDFSLKMAFAVRDSLRKRGFKTVLTRSTDNFISLPGRVQIANATPRSIFISLHFNSGSSAAAGIETWALSPQGTSSTFMGQRNWDAASFRGNNRDSENIALATAVHAMVIHNLSLSSLAERGLINRGLVDRGIKRARWTVLTGCNRPGILFEGGFVTNPTECRLIAAPAYQNYLAETIAEAVQNYRRALHPNVAKQPTYGR